MIMMTSGGDFRADTMAPAIRPMNFTLTAKRWTKAAKNVNGPTMLTTQYR